MWSTPPPRPLRAHIIPIAPKLPEGLDEEPGALVARGIQRHPHGVLLQQGWQPLVHRQVFVAFHVQKLRHRWGWSEVTRPERPGSWGGGHWALGHTQGVRHIITGGYTVTQTVTRMHTLPQRSSQSQYGIPGQGAAQQEMTRQAFTGPGSPSNLHEETQIMHALAPAIFSQCSPG